MKRKINNKGFSLPELIIVMAIMAVLVGILLPAYLKYVNNSKVSADLANAEELAGAIRIEIAEGRLSAGIYTGAGGSECTILQDVPNWPVIQRNGSLSWRITVNDVEIEKIEIGDGSSFDRVYPDPMEPDGYYGLYHLK